ncbi:uncharacterized protein C8R40DRAFT_1073685 [Lentinula edodes]|uniref:uncharacterized protein n=1 Tax=Lentinula edodes TaxID=5353 RepID=UPI001E8DBFAE|nr:uncharacterized protein C8R40DRAFT_1073685 [Lentinula edodes]KAH7869876.1 hypothetical protein C8R40DRAFT_1073685 [Lentinula edodes]
MSDPPYGKDMCNYCMKVFGRDNLRTCAQCRFVRYCSRGCQRAAWSAHKKSCKTTKDLREVTESDRDIHIANEKLSKWMNTWRMSLTSWSLWALSPNASEKDKLATHCFVLHLDHRPDAPSPAQLFRLREVSVLSRSRVHDLFIEHDVSQHHIDDFLTDLRGENTVQIIVFADDLKLMRLFYFSIRDIVKRQAKELDDIDRMIMDGVPRAFQASVEAGNSYPKMTVTGHKQYLPFIAYSMARAKAEASPDAQDDS